MAVFFFNLLNMSINSIVLIAIMLIVRSFFKRIPKRFICILWGLLAIRMVVPLYANGYINVLPLKIVYADKTNGENSNVKFEESEKPSVSKREAVETAEYEMRFIRNTSNEGQTGNDKSAVFTVRASLIAENIMIMVWLGGIAVLAIVFLLQFVRIRKIMAKAIPLKIVDKDSFREEENIYISDVINVPFVFGIFAPKIYLPESMDKSYYYYVLEHEKWHIKRKDNLWKVLGLLILIIHWFNPLIWIGYRLFSGDIEMACDERVIHNKTTEEIKNYAMVLLKCSTRQKVFLDIYPTFAVISVKKRIKRIVNRKKMNFISVLTLIGSCILITSCSVLVTGKQNEMLENNDLFSDNISRGYRSIMQIEGAKKDEKNPAFYTEIPCMPKLPDQFAESLREEEVLIGFGEMWNPEAININIFDSTYYASTSDKVTWHISSFDITVDEPIKDLSEKEVVRVITASRFFDGNYLETYNFETVGDAYKGENEGLFVLERITDDSKWTIGNNLIKLGEYADYYLRAYYESDGTEINYLGTNIKIEEIKGGSNL